MKMESLEWEEKKGVRGFRNNCTHKNDNGEEGDFDSVGDDDGERYTPDDDDSDIDEISSVG